MDYEVISKGKTGRFLDTSVVRGARRDMSDHLLAEGKLKMG